jgi:phospholipase C
MIASRIVSLVALSSLALAVPQTIEVRGGDWKSKIKNVVVLVEENRSFDTFAGGLDYSRSIDGLIHHNYCNSM